MKRRTLFFLSNVAILLFFMYCYLKLDNNIMIFIFISTIVLLFTLLFSNINNNMNFHKNMSLMLSIIICICIISSINLNKKLWDDTAINIQTADTVETWVIDSTKEGMNAIQYRHFCHTVMYSLLKKKNINCPLGTFSDERNKYLVNKITDINYLDIGLISKNDIDIYIAKYSPQQLIFNIDNGNSYKMYLVTGTEWQKDKKVFFLYDEDSGIWVIPESLLEKKYLNKEFTSNINEYIILDSNCSIVNVQYQYVSDVCMDDAIGINNRHNINVIRNFIYLVILFVTGLCSLFLFHKKLLREMIIVLAFPVGTIIEILLVLIYGIIKIPISTFTLYFGIAVIALTGISSLYKNRTKQTEKRDKDYSLICLGIIIIAMLYFSVFPYYYLSPDSVENIFWGNYIIQNNGFGNAFNDISSYSLFMPLVNTGAALLGVKLLYSFIPFVAFNTVMIFIYFLNKILLCNNKNTKFNYLTILMGVILLVSTPMFRLSSVWILNNELIGLFLGISVLLVIYSVKTTDYIYAYIALPFFLVSSCARIEGPMFGAIIVIMMLYYLRRNLALIKIYSGSLTFCTVLLFIIQLVYNGTVQGDFWTIRKGSLVLILVISAEVYVVFYRILHKKLKFIYENMTTILPVLLITGGGLAGLFQKDMFYQNLIAFFENTFNIGYYSGFWLVGIIVCMNSFTIKSEEFTFLRGIISGYLFMIFDLMMFRTGIPLHAGASDSSCRMFLHAMPVMTIFIVLFLKNAFDSGNFNIKKKTTDI